MMLRRLLGVVVMDVLRTLCMEVPDLDNGLWPQVGHTEQLDFRRTSMPPCIVPCRLIVGRLKPVGAASAPCIGSTCFFLNTTLVAKFPGREGQTCRGCSTLQLAIKKFKTIPKLIDLHTNLSLLGLFAFTIMPCVAALTFLRTHAEEHDAWECSTIGLRTLRAACLRKFAPVPAAAISIAPFTIAASNAVEMGGLPVEDFEPLRYGARLIASSVVVCGIGITSQAPLAEIGCTVMLTIVAWFPLGLAASKYMTSWVARWCLFSVGVTAGALVLHLANHMATKSERGLRAHASCQPVAAWASLGGALYCAEWLCNAVVKPSLMVKVLLGGVLDLVFIVGCSHLLLKRQLHTKRTLARFFPSPCAAQGNIIVV